jgi:hypothetical protein
MVFDSGVNGLAIAKLVLDIWIKWISRSECKKAVGLAKGDCCE